MSKQAEQKSVGPNNGIMVMFDIAEGITIIDMNDIGGISTWIASRIESCGI